MNLKRKFAAAALVVGTMASAHAAQTLKVGMVLPMSGPHSSYGQQILSGARLYLEQHGDVFGDRKVELIVKDDTGVAPDISRRVAQELLVKDEVDILAGFGFTPAAFSVAPLSVQTKTPMIVMNAATSSVTEKSPYIVRVSMALPQTTAPLALWAANNDINRVYTLVADFGPGHDAEKQFVETFTQAGGEIVGGVRTPLQNPDFSPFLQRVKDAKPDAVFVFVPAGEQGIALLKGYRERGLDKDGIQLIATGDLNSEDVLDAMGDYALDIISSFHYSEALATDENRAYTQAFYSATSDVRPNFMSVAGYDGMHLIELALAKTGGDASGEKFIEAAKGLSWESPRGPVRIDPNTRDIVQDIYIRKAELIDGKVQNVAFDRVAEFRDPAKE